METSLISILVFIAITTLYIIFKQTLGYKYDDKGTPHRLKILLGIYVFASFISQYSFNSGATETLCGSVQTTPAFLMTAIPNLLMFGLIIIIFAFFPGWKAPFSNTFGYAAAVVGGVKTVFIDMLDTIPKKDAQGNPLPRAAMVDHVYKDPGLMINEITPANFKTFVSEMIKEEMIDPSAKKYFSKLYKLVTLKDVVAEWWWYVLVGSLVIVTSYQALTQIACIKNTDEMIKASADWSNSQDASGNDTTTSTVYYTRE